MPRLIIGHRGADLKAIVAMMINLDCAAANPKATDEDAEKRSVSHEPATLRGVVGMAMCHDPSPS
jgi:hypothetical protein